MRPRPDAAENKPERGRGGRDRQHEASMRPRPDAAENVVALAHRAWVAAGFNEAAARCRGKLRQEGSGA